MPPGKTFIGAKRVTNKTPVKTIKIVSVKNTLNNYQLATTFLLIMNITLHKKN